MEGTPDKTHGYLYTAADAVKIPIGYLPRNRDTIEMCIDVSEGRISCICLLLVSCFTYYFIMKKEAIRSSET
jgi:hypothetical protein